MKFFALLWVYIRWIFFISLALFVSLVLINAFDEDLRPEAQAALNWQSPANMLVDNGFVILLGLDAPINEDALQVGTRRYQEELGRYRTLLKTHVEPTISSEPSADKINSPIDLADAKWKIFYCDYEKKQSCVDFYRTLTTQEVALFYASQRPLEARFNAIKQSKHYTEAMPPMISGYIPKYSNLTAASELARMKAVRLITSGNMDAGVAEFVENATFSRKLMMNANSLVARMIAVAMVQKDMRILSELITQYPAIAVDFNAQWLPITSTISSFEFSFAKPFQHERNMTLQVMYQLKFQVTKKSNWFNKFIAYVIFKQNATVNLFYDWWQVNLDLLQAGPQNQLEAKREIHKQQQALLGFGYAPYYLKNPIGKILVSVATPEYSNYVERQYDLEGQIQLLALQIAMSRQYLKDENAESQITSLLDAYPNPYTGKAMRYDRKKHQIVFEGHQVSRANFGKSLTYQFELSH